MPRAGWLVLNSKRAPRNFYKGKGVRSVGKHTKKGKWSIGFSLLPRCSILPEIKARKQELLACSEDT